LFDCLYVNEFLLHFISLSAKPHFISPDSRERIDPARLRPFDGDGPRILEIKQRHSHVYGVVERRCEGYEEARRVEIVVEMLGN